MPTCIVKKDWAVPIIFLIHKQTKARSTKLSQNLKQFPFSLSISIFSDSIPQSPSTWTTQMSPSKSSRWWGLSAKKPRRKPTRSLFPPKKYTSLHYSDPFIDFNITSLFYYRSLICYLLIRILHIFGWIDLKLIELIGLIWNWWLSSVTLFCCRNSTSRSCSWLRLIRRRSVKSTNAKRSKLMFGRKCNVLCLVHDFIFASLNSYNSSVYFISCDIRMQIYICKWFMVMNSHYNSQIFKIQKVFL